MTRKSIQIIIVTILGLMSCNENKPKIMGVQFDFTEDQVDAHPTDSFGKYIPGEFVSDSVFMINQEIIDSLLKAIEK